MTLARHHDHVLGQPRQGRRLRCHGAGRLDEEVARRRGIHRVLGDRVEAEQCCGPLAVDVEGRPGEGGRPEGVWLTRS